jgi:hypothetical protein
VQEWLRDNRNFIESNYKKIQFDVDITDELNKKNSQYKCEFIQGDFEKFYIEFGEKKLISNGKYWINVENRTKQAIFQLPDSTFLKNISLVSDFKKLQKLISLSILKKDVATFYHNGIEIRFEFSEEKLNEVEMKLSGKNIVFKNIQLQKIESPDSSYFQFNRSDFSIIDLRE